MTFNPSSGGQPITVTVNEFKSSGVAMGMYNTDESIRSVFEFFIFYPLKNGFSTYYCIFKLFPHLEALLTLQCSTLCREITLCI